MPSEPRTRITLLLPAPTTLPQHYLVHDVLTELANVCGGVTASQEIPPVFSGWWFNKETMAFDEDAILLIIADARVPQNSAALATYLDTLKRKAQRDFDQEIIWITTNQLERIATDDYVR